jgi:hypothetical protein
MDVFWNDPMGRSRKDSHSSHRRFTLLPQKKFLLSRGGEKNLFLIIVTVLGNLKGVGELTSYFLCGGGIDVFWNDQYSSSEIRLCTLVPEVYFYYFHCKGERENKPLVESGH